MSMNEQNRSIQRSLLWMLLPGIVLFGLFCYGPLFGLLIAFKEFSMSAGVLGSPWCGLENFSRLFASLNFWNALWNTLFISVLRLTFGFIVPIVLALMLNEVRIGWFRRSIQTLTYIPYFLSWVILGGIFMMLFAGNGPVNRLVVAAGGESIPFLSNGFWFIAVVIGTGIWQSAGYGAVIYLAALSGIDPTLYEAAVVDGASRFQQIRQITIPALMPTIVVLFILNLGQILNAGFDQIYNMYNPMVYDVSDILDTFILRRLIELDFGVATAAGLFKSLIGMVLIVAANYAVRLFSRNEHGIW